MSVHDQPSHLSEVLDLLDLALLRAQESERKATLYQKLYEAVLDFPLTPEDAVAIWLQTWSGKAWRPLVPRSEDLDLPSIAMQLGHLCRFTGATRFHYSVAQHSLLMADCADPDVVPYVLAHDMAEPFTGGDLPSPLKRLFPVKRVLEDAAMEVICSMLRLPWPWPIPVSAEVKRLDLAMLAAERDQVMAPAPIPWQPLPAPLDVAITSWSPTHAGQAFLARSQQAFAVALLAGETRDS